MKFLRYLADLASLLWSILTMPADPSPPTPALLVKTPPTKSPWSRWLWSMRGEMFAAAAVVLAFLFAGPLLRQVDGTAAPLDIGALSMVGIGVVAVIAAVVAFFLLIRIFAPFVDLWFDGDVKEEDGSEGISFENDWRDCGPAVRIAIFFAIFLGVLGAIAGISIAAF